MSIAISRCGQHDIRSLGRCGCPYFVSGIPYPENARCTQYNGHFIWGSFMQKCTEVRKTRDGIIPGSI